jgi:hypothetical protein
MAETTEHSIDTPFFAWLVLMAAKLFTTCGAFDDLSFSKDMQVKLLCTSTHTKTYFFPSKYGRLKVTILYSEFS